MSVPKYKLNGFHHQTYKRSNEHTTTRLIAFQSLKLEQRTYRSYLINWLFLLHEIFTAVQTILTWISVSKSAVSYSILRITTDLNLWNIQIEFNFLLTYRITNYYFIITSLTKRSLNHKIMLSPIVVSCQVLGSRRNLLYRQPHRIARYEASPRLARRTKWGCLSISILEVVINY